MKQQISATIHELLEYARLAPSVHNTQPWHFTVSESTVSLSPASERFLKAGDPTHRELWISLGICLETLLQAAEGLGLEAEILSLQTDSTSKPIATVQFSPIEVKNSQTLTLLKQRHSYRGAMKPADLPSSLFEDLSRRVADLPGVSVSFLENKESIAAVADFTYKGMSLALSSPVFRHELAELINYNWSQTHVGMHGFVLNRGLLGSIWEKWSIALGLDIKQKAKADQQKIQEASALVFVASAGDVPKFWFNSGRAYMRIAMEITKNNLAHSTVAAPVEAASFHEDIEKMLQTKDRIQAMIRIGAPTRPVGRTSPRLSVEELLT